MTVFIRAAPRPVPNKKPWRALRLTGSVLAAVFVTGAVASTGAGTAAAPSETTVRFDPLAQETQVRERVADDLCVSFHLGREWRLARVGDETVLQAPSGDDLDIRLRPAAELSAFPQADLAARDAAALQQSYEELIGKPAQVIEHRPTSLPGVTRWSAAWIDSNLESPSHSLAVETYIVDVNGSAALELTMNASDISTYRAQTSRILESLRVTTGSECRDRPVAGR